MYKVQPAESNIDDDVDAGAGYVGLASGWKMMEAQHREGSQGKTEETALIMMMMMDHKGDALSFCMIIFFSWFSRLSCMILFVLYGLHDIARIVSSKQAEQFKIFDFQKLSRFCRSSGLWWSRSQYLTYYSNSTRSGRSSGLKGHKKFGVFPPFARGPVAHKSTPGQTLDSLCCTFTAFTAAAAATSVLLISLCALNEELKNVNIWK